MDSTFIHQTNPSGPPPALWHSQDVEYPQYGIPPSAHNMTSPPSTPMTPAPIAPLHMTTFPGSLCPIDPHNYPNMHRTVNAIPALSHSTWPPEYRIFALCQELNRYSPGQMNTTEGKLFWEAFYVEFFHEMSVLIIEADFGDGYKSYTLQGNSIVWYFKTIMDSGISRFNLVLGKTTHSYRQQIQRLESTEANQELDYELPHHTKICARGQIAVELTIEDKPHIISWLFSIQNHFELIPRFCVHSPSLEASLTGGLSCQGLPNSTQSLLVKLQDSSLKERNSPQMMIQNFQMGMGNAIQHYWGEPRPLSTQQEMIGVTTGSMMEPDHSSFDNSQIPIAPLSFTHPSSTSSSPNSTSSVPINSTSSANGGSGSHKQSSHDKKTAVKKPQLIMIATEPALFSEDMVHGYDERKITRIDNHLIKQSIVHASSSLSIATPSTTPTEPDITPNTTHIINNSLPWLEPTSSEWTIPQTMEQR